MSLTRPRLALAAAAVARAATLCRTLRHEMADSMIQEKADDAGPVTIADYASQAVISLLLSRAEPGTTLLAEEHPDQLAGPEHVDLRRAICRAVGQELEESLDEGSVLDAIGRAGPQSGAKGAFWTLDPIDGTKGFIRGGQYAIALAWIEGGHVRMGALACPMLRLSFFPGVTGWVLAAEEGCGLKIAPLDGSRAHRAWLDRFEAPGATPGAPHSPRMRFCESVESAHSDQTTSEKIATRLGLSEPPLRMDSQAKYAAVALGEAAIYLRVPTRADYQEKVWDHAAGKICVEEAGGTTSDLHGKPLRFGLGSTLCDNHGVIATNGIDISRVLRAVHDTKDG